MAEQVIEQVSTDLLRVITRKGWTVHAFVNFPRRIEITRWQGTNLLSVYEDIPEDASDEQVQDTVWAMLRKLGYE